MKRKVKKSSGIVVQELSPFAAVWLDGVSVMGKEHEKQCGAHEILAIKPGKLPHVSIVQIFASGGGHPQCTVMR